MAKDEKTTEEDAPAPKPKKKRLIVIVVALVVVLAGGGVAAYLLLNGGSGKKHAEAEVKETSQGKTVMVPLDDKFTVNLLGEDGNLHYLLVPKIELEVGNERVASLIEENKSKVSDRISGVLRSKSLRDMLEPGSDQKLKEDLRKVINETLDLRGADRGKGVKEVILPASFLVQ